jgi:simple sugar transport system permease protein
MVLIIQAIIILLVTAERVLPIVQQRVSAARLAKMNDKDNGQTIPEEGGSDVA